MSRRTLAAIFLCSSLAAGASAQEEFGRFSAGQIEGITKRPASLSGSLSILWSNSNRGYEGSFGGTLIQDRLWFFASGSQRPGFRLGTEQPQMEPRDFNRATFVKATTQLGDSHGLDASFASGSSSLLSLRYDAAVSSSMFFSASFLRGSAAQRQSVFGAVSP